MPTEIFQLKGGGGKQLPIGVELPNDYAMMNVPPILMAGADGILWNIGTNNAYAYSVEFLIVNVNNALVTVNIGVDLVSAGALTPAEFWMFNEVIPSPGTSGWKGPFIINGSDDVRGWCVTGANLANGQWRIKRLW